MSSIIDSPEIRDAVQPMSVAFYHAATDLGWVDEDVELLEGFPVRKMSKSPQHEYFVRKLLRMLELALPENCFVTKESPLTCERSEPEPDLMVVEGDEDSFRTSHPETAKLVIEVSIHTLERDRRKAAIYAGAGVEEYWLVDPGTASITVHRAPGEDGYGDTSVFDGESCVASRAIEGFELRLPDFFG